MRMFSTCIYMQFGKDSAAKTVVRNHTFNSEFNHSYRVFGKHFACGSEACAAKITAVTEISFLNEFFAGQNYFICINYNYMISGIQCFPRRIFATSAARRPRVLSAASTTYHLRSMLDGLAIKDFILMSLLNYFLFSVLC